MNSEKVFNSQVFDLGAFATNISNEAIKDEPMFFNASIEYAIKNGGDITRQFLCALPDGWENAVFDSRVHMLMPGWYPAIPGYHHDDVPRPAIPVGKHFATAGQPDYDTPRYRAEHILGLVNADICPTEFAIGSCIMPKIEDGDLIYRAWHKEVLKLIESGVLQVKKAEDRRMYYFDCDTFHTGVKSISNGWRWFGRVSRNTERCNQITNEIRKQVQVYLEFPMEGW